MPEYLGAAADLSLLFFLSGHVVVMMDGLGGDQLGYRRLLLCPLLVFIGANADHGHKATAAGLGARDSRSAQLLSFEGLGWLCQYRIITA